MNIFCWMNGFNFGCNWDKCWRPAGSHWRAHQEAYAHTRKTCNSVWYGDGEDGDDGEDRELETKWCAMWDGSKMQADDWDACTIRNKALVRVVTLGRNWDARKTLAQLSWTDSWTWRPSSGSKMWSDDLIMYVCVWLQTDFEMGGDDDQNQMGDNNIQRPLNCWSWIQSLDDNDKNGRPIIIITSSRKELLSELIKTRSLDDDDDDSLSHLSSLLYLERWWWY